MFLMPREYGLKESWTKEFVVRPLVRIERPQGFAKNGEHLFVDNNGWGILRNFSYCETNNFLVRGLQDSFHASKAIADVESLVSILNH